MTYGSLFSGAGLMDLGIERAGLTCRFQCEIDKDARRVLAHHWPHLICHEDVRLLTKKKLPRVDVLVGGFPCQDLSVAGQRAGILTGKQSGLWWEMLRVIGEIRPRVVLWENVPGLLSSDGGRDLRRVLSSLAEHNYFGCVRTLDSRYFGVAQRRRRLFGVFVRNDPTAGRAAQILALREGRDRNPPQGQEKGADIACALAASARGTGDGHGQGHAMTTQQAAESGHLVAGTLNYGNASGGFRTEPGEHLVASSLDASMMHGADDNAARANHLVAFCQTPGEGKRQDSTSCNFVTHALTSNGGDASEDGTGRGTPLAVIPLDMRQGSRGETMTNNRREGIASGGAPGTGIGEEGDPCPSEALPPIAPNAGHGLLQGMMVRRITPTECLRLMGAPDDFLDLDPALSDSAKYRLCGNGVVVPAAAWIARRIMAARMF